MQIGSENSPVSTVHGPTFHQNITAKAPSASAIWLSGSSTGSSNVGGSPRDMTNSRPTTLPSSSSQPFGFGYALMSPRPSSSFSFSVQAWPFPPQLETLGVAVRAYRVGDGCGLGRLDPARRSPPVPQPRSPTDQSPS